MTGAEIQELERMAPDFTGETLPAWRAGVSASALMAKQFPPIRYVVRDYLPEGLSLLAGAPKIGKSWWALNVAYAVAAGVPAFGSVAVQAGDVLYLALEDNPRRLQNRLRIMSLDDAPERLTFCTQWPTIGEGAVAEIEAWMDAVRRPTLVVVDVLAKVRDATGGRDNAYEGDYAAMVGLQELAGRSGLAVMALHHTRKMDADSPFDTVSGTRGLTGAADTILVLKKETATGRTVLFGTGRDIAEIETAFELQSDNGTWKVLGAASELGRTDEREAILSTLRKAGKPQSAQEVADMIGKPTSTVRRTLNRMAGADEIEKPSRGLFACLNGPNVPKPDQWDNRTDETGLSTDIETEEGWQ